MNFPVFGFFRWLVTWNGVVTRRQYAASGFVFTAIKFLIDRHVAGSYGVEWNVWNYFVPTRANSIFGTVNAHMYATLWAIALPFFWVGLSLTLRRLRSARLQPGWIFLFFVPVANLVFFLTLCVLPDREDARQLREPNEGGYATAITGIMVSVALCMTAAVLSISGLHLYGNAVFLGVPFFLGFISSAVYNLPRSHKPWSSAVVGVATVVVAGLLLFGFAYEGLVCLLMAMPLALPLAIAGSLLAERLLARRRGPANPTMAAWIFVLPLAILGEYEMHATPPVLHVTTSIEIAAPPEVVWQNVISFPPLAPPQDWVFQTGIAYPTAGVIYGHGVGAVRHCKFSTGEFVEPITVWDEPQLLAFDVAEQPMSMRELSPWKITPPHLERNDMRALRGQFRLVALPNGHTRLEGTTWYQNYFWPQPYWRVWSDFIVHRIHRRVLGHVKRQSEAQFSTVMHNIVR
ncbi:MAG: hypothetical protein ACRD3E_15615 [Terriglobales bacterium]